MKPSYKLFILIGILFILFLFLAAYVKNVPYYSLDLHITNIFQATNFPFEKNIMIFISLPGYNVYKYSLLLFVVLILLFLEKYKESFMLVFVSLGAEVVQSLIKDFVHRLRPSTDLISYIYKTETSFSFPSGHVVYYVAFFGFIIYLINLNMSNIKLKYLINSICILFILTVGFSRIYLGAHWITDVMGGYLLGFVWLLISIVIYNYWTRANKNVKSKN